LLTLFLAPTQRVPDMTTGFSMPCNGENPWWHARWAHVIPWPVPRRFPAASAVLHIGRTGVSGADDNSAVRPKPVDCL